MNTRYAPARPTGSQPATPGHGPIDSHELLRGATTIEILHAGQRYFLRVTRENKLILTK